MRVIAKSTLRKFWEQPAHADAQGPLESWYDEAVQASWTSPQEVKVQYRHASICGNHRVVLNIAGNKHRLVVEMQYRVGIAWVKFIGPHAHYDRIDVETVNEYKADSQRRRLACRFCAPGADISGAGRDAGGR